MNGNKVKNKEKKRRRRESRGDGKVSFYLIDVTKETGPCCTKLFRTPFYTVIASSIVEDVF